MGQTVSGRELTCSPRAASSCSDGSRAAATRRSSSRSPAGRTPAYAVYKPEAGERPLSDFEPGLYRRERAAYLLSESLGWGLVPPTVIREEAPLGVGSLQWFIECDFQRALLHAVRGRPRDPPRPGPDRPVRLRRQQHRPQERPRAARRRRPGLGHRPRAVLLGSVQAAHRDLGLRRGAHPRCPAGGHRPARREPCLPRWRSSSTTTRSPPCSAASSAWSTPGRCRWTALACVIPGRSYGRPRRSQLALRPAPALLQTYRKLRVGAQSAGKSAEERDFLHEALTQGVLTAAGDGNTGHLMTPGRPRRLIHELQPPYGRYLKDLRACRYAQMAT